jgi:hypothetical protein
MTAADQNNHTDDALKEKLEELEALLDAEEAGSRPGRIKIPVLDELVTEADFIDDDDADDVQMLDEQITELAKKLEQKFSGELDQLVTLLKSNFRNTIVEELRTQANIDQDQLPLANDLDERSEGVLVDADKEDP